MDNLGSRLKNVRLKAGMTLRELARRADVSPSFVSQIENGKSQPSVATLYEFAQLLGVSIDELFDSTGGVASRPTGRVGGVPTPHLASLDPTGGFAARPAGRAARVPTPHLASLDPTGGFAPRPAGRAVRVPTPHLASLDPTGGFAPRPAGRAVRVPTPHLASLDPRSGSAGRPATVRGRGSNGATHPSNAWHPSEYANRVSVVHPSHRSSLNMADGVVWERLAATPEHAVNFMKITYAPGATSTGGGAPVSHEGYEYGYVLKGTLEIVVGSETFTLHAGESMGFDSMIPHVLRNVGDGEFEGIWFVHGRERAVPTTRRIGKSRRAAVTVPRTGGVRRTARARRA